MLNLKTLMTAVVVATATLTTTPVVLADDDDRRIYQQNKAQYISHQKAGQIAKNRVKNSRVVKVEFDHDDGIATYQVELRTNSGIQYDVKINAKTGKVIRVERDD